MALDQRGGAVRIGRDLYKRAHRHYAAALAADVRTVGAKVRSDTSYWQTAIEGYVRDHSLDAVVESALADPDDFRTSSAAYRSSQHNIEVVVLATPEAWSQLGILDRFLAEAVDGAGGRFVSCPERTTTPARRTCSRLSRSSKPSSSPTDHRGDPRWNGSVRQQVRRWRRAPPAGSPAADKADKAVTRRHSRAWTARETAAFNHDIARAEVRVHRDVPGEDVRLAVVRDTRRAAALAEPVRRIAQPRRRARGVDLHRLSASEHRWVFDELIVPT
ncbi:hypothetical protein BM536_007130 [Streptomyces phaeoluteigriseus]|uniref:UDP-N-acetylglucosamine kinase n=1 Tax=Streptomyces phaeoluteigriseus TaxID=114686 RepID=A0A1V6MWT9_9ACTN|nr:zeta toxin family protein [Streptomyces phaeoluteigriseus]OQD56747.1 hypothetical protein BM536_007130 [Streptomyces phaeoluteigriseus]